MPKNNNLTEIYMIRHAETVMNTNPHIIGGRSNSTPLTERGVGQAIRLGATLKERGILPDGAYASPARRTRDTGYYSLTAMALDLEPTIADEIQELSQGLAEGLPRAGVYTPEVKRDIDRQGKNFRLEGSESMNDVGERMEDWTLDTFEPGGGRYFVYTHGGAIKYLASHIEDWSRQHTYETEVGNATLNLFLLGDDGLSLGYLSRDAATL
jgi:broad specificity phosphatase PhoE